LEPLWCFGLKRPQCSEPRSYFSQWSLECACLDGVPKNEKRIAGFAPKIAQEALETRSMRNKTNLKTE
jgi:hypothetical protein